MSNKIQIANCEGIDCAIKFAQDIIYAHLNPIWNAQWNCYPRIYKNKKYTQEDGEFFVPEFLDGDFEYTQDTLFDDRVDVTSFFLVGDVRPFENDNATATVSLIFSCLIDKLYNEVQKPDEKMHRDIIAALKMLPQQWELTDLKTGVDQVYSEFLKRGLKYSDMSKRHLCRFDLDVTYSYNC